MQACRERAFTFTGLLIFRAVADPRNSGIYAKSREIIHDLIIQAVFCDGNQFTPKQTSGGLCFSVTFPETNNYQWQCSMFLLRRDNSLPPPPPPCKRKNKERELPVKAESCFHTKSCKWTNPRGATKPWASTVSFVPFLFSLRWEQGVKWGRNHVLLRDTNWFPWMFFLSFGFMGNLLKMDLKNCSQEQQSPTRTHYRIE